MSKFYVTTPIYYVNGAPHIGHAYTTILADAMARYHRLKGDDVFFLTGTDEHGLKIQRAAEERGISPQEMVDENSQKFRDLFERLELTHDRFIRTTEDDHRKAVETMVERMRDAGDIYLDKYEGWYSASDEAYYDESEIEDGKAIASGSEVEWVEEESYFFRLSKYEDQLLEWYENNPQAVAPKARKNEVATFVESGLNDLSISRTTFSWGIPMPDDPEHVLYVWVDALTNYISAIDAFEDTDNFDKFWPADIHLIGKDILRFHAVYWPAFLMSAELPLPEQVYAHGWWTVEGEKMSKSKGNWIDAFELADEYELDVLRYYMMREMPLGKDGNFSKERVVERNNAELADNVGNLVNRTLSMAQGFIDGIVPTVSDEPTEDEDIELRNLCIQTREAVDKAMNDRQPHRALEEIMALSGETNNYIQTVQPWTLKDDETRLGETLYSALEAIRFVAVLLSPFVPDACGRILDGLGTDDDLRTIESLDKWGGLEAGTEVEKPDVLFQKLEAPTDDDTDEDEDEPVSDDETTDEEGANLISFDQFLDVEMRVGEIVDAESVEDADKLLKLSVDVGDDTPRTVVAGVAQTFGPDELTGWKVTMVTNLEPATLFGIESQAMLLAAERDDGSFALARYPDDVEAGTSVS